jgi:tetratricopeptide (TPR) repeat protein
MTPQISIITPWLDHPEFIADYERATQGVGVEVIVIDNASASANALALRQMVERLGGKYLRNEENRWFSAANNQGMAAASGQIILFLNNDISATDGWLGKVRADIGERELSGPTLRTTQVEEFSVSYLEGWCIAAARQTWDELGGWNEQAFQMPYGEDVELSLRARRMGLELKQANWPVAHKVNGTSYEMLAVGEGIKSNVRLLASMLKGEAAPIAPVPEPTPGYPLTREQYLRAGRLTDAQRDYREALARQPKRAEWWLTYGIILRDCGRYEASVEALRQAALTNPALAATAYSEIGVTFDAAGKFADAVEAMRQVARLHPELAAAHANLAIALTRAGRPEAAQAARAALRLDPHCAPAHAELAHVLLQDGNVQEALAEAELAIQSAPNSVVAHYVRGCANKLLGNRAQALAAFDRALAIDPLNDAVARERADLLSRVT